MNGKLVATLFVGVILGLTASFAVRPPHVLAQAKADGPKWEHKVIWAPHITAPPPPTPLQGAANMTKEMNTLAADGWEYMEPLTTSNVLGGVFLHFRRPKK